LIALFAVFRGSQSIDEDSRTLIESGPDGWWYTALLPSQQRVVAYLTDADLAPQELRSKQGFLAQLSRTKHISACLRAYDDAVEDVKTVQANSARLDSFVGEGWTAVGDAAVAFDPLSSQGILTALFTGLKAAEALCQSSTPNAFTGYSYRLTTIYNAYLQNRSAFYAQEQRWATHPFWRRRHTRE